ncbi:MAG: DNA-directed RNA polymerase subunit omega [Chthonomonas sp.]|nr:DNA-directed RNA polymerase subunit omega [Chthonomonas sp.]
MNSSNEPVRPTADALNDFELGRYVLSNLAAKRAKQLKDGAPPLVRVDSNNPLTIALAEIAAGKIRANLPAENAQLAVTEVAFDDTLPTELGILLPGLDEIEADGVSDLLDHELMEEEIAEGGLTLDALLDDEAEVETVAPEHEDSVSLSDLEIEEEHADDENSDDEA